MTRLQSLFLSGIRPNRALRFAAAGLFLLALVWQHVQATRLGYRAEAARQRIIALRCANGALRMELESVLAPANLSAAARGRLGMSLVAPQTVRNLDAPAPDGSRPGLLQRLLARTRRILDGAGGIGSSAGAGRTDFLTAGAVPT